MARKEKKSGTYFSVETEDAIIRYNEMRPGVERDLLFRTTIYPALDKLVENVIHTWKLHKYDTTYEDMKLDTVSFLLEKLDTYTKERGKAYSLFTIISKNYLIQRNVKLYKEENNYLELDVLDDSRDIGLEVARDNYTESLKDFIPLWVNHVESNLDKFFDKNKRDKAIALAVLELFETADSIDDFNKKKLYILIREQTGIKTQFITSVVKQLKDNFYTKFQEYRNK